MAQLLLAVCVLAVIIVGILLMTQILSLEQLGMGIRRSFVLLWFAIVLLLLIRVALLPILLCGLVWLKTMMLWIFFIVIVGIASLFVGRLIFLRLVNRNARRAHSKREEEV